MQNSMILEIQSLVTPKEKKKKILGMELQEHFSALDFSPLKITFMKMFSLYINFLLKRKEKQNIPGYAATFKIQRCWKTLSIQNYEEMRMCYI